MAAVGILIALRERERSGRGAARRLLDVRRLAVVSGDARRRVPGRRARAAPGRAPAGRGIVCYRPYRCADGYVTLGALEPKFWADVLRGRGAGGSARTRLRSARVRHASRTSARSSPRARASSGARSPPSTTAAWSRCWTSTRRSDSELVASREMVVELDQPGAERPVGLLGVPVKLSRTPGDPQARARSGARGAHAPRCWRRPGFRDRGDRGAARGRGGGGAAERSGEASFMA